MRARSITLALLGCICSAGPAYSAMDGPYAFDKWHLSKSSKTSDAHVQQNGSSGFTITGNDSAFGRNSVDRFTNAVQSAGIISGTLTVDQEMPGRLTYSFEGAGPAFK